MIKFLSKLLNLGINAETDSALAKKIRLGNTIPMMGMVSGSVVLLAIYFTGGPLSAVLFTLFVVVTLFIPLLLNYLGKNVSSRIFHILLSYLYIALFAIAFGGNAIKFYWKFCVADNGIGIRPEKHKDIFEMFTKLHLPTDYKGHGIGLAFCKEIVDTHNGKIWVESSPGEGSRFYFTIQKKLLP